LKLAKGLPAVSIASLIGDKNEIRLFQDTYQNGYKKRQVLSDEDVKRETRKALSLGISEIVFRVELAQEEEQLDNDFLKIRALTTSNNSKDGEEKRKKTRMPPETIFHESSIESERFTLFLVVKVLFLMILLKVSQKVLHRKVIPPKISDTCFIPENLKL
jgi:hypothetical protein